MENLIIVSVSEYSFKKALDENYYAFPSSYNRKMKKYIAFYRIKDVKSITHYAEIIESEIKNIKEFSIRDILLMFGHSPDKKIIVFKLKPLIKLEKPVTANGIGIQGIKYSNLDKLISSTKIYELLRSR